MSNKIDACIPLFLFVCWVPYKLDNYCSNYITFVDFVLFGFLAD